MPTTPKHFRDMTDAQLQQFIDGCHRDRDYDSQFDAACAERNSRDHDSSSHVFGLNLVDFDVRR